MDTQTVTVEKVHLWPRALAGAALLSSALFGGWVYQTHDSTTAFWTAWLPVVLTAIPLFLVRRKPFEYASLAAGVLLLVLASLLPAALILLAPIADPRRSPRRARVAVLVGAALVVVTCVASAGPIHRSLTEPPAGFVVHGLPDLTATDSAAVKAATSGPGVVETSTVTRADGKGVTMTVRFGPGLSADGQEQLRQALAKAPGVTKVCSWYRDNRLRSAC
ncbi:hypothetical protein [Micromonospora vulcania]|uniref:Uncharacterized protein n=1 Tax=Micromonospora vulcania TaxID=1441873 RepID=A0ABW1H844_9ACTN